MSYCSSFAEKYRGQQITIFKDSALWWWKVTFQIDYKLLVQTFSKGYCSLQSAVTAAMKYIDKKL